MDHPVFERAASEKGPVRCQSAWMSKPCMALLDKEERDNQRQRIDERDAFLKLIKDLQAKHKVFAAEKYPDEESILNFMNMILKRVVRELLDSIAVVNNPFAMMICRAFFGLGPDSTADKLSGMELLYSLLVAAFVSNSMRHTYGDKKEFANKHKYFETEALSLFNEMYLRNKEKLEYHILAFDYERIFQKPNNRSKEENDKWKKPSRELLCVAYRGQCMKFIAHEACQNYIKTRWEEGKVKKLFDLDSKVESSRFSAILSLIFWPPRSKYILHLSFKIFYLILFGIVLIDKPWRKMVTPQGKIDWNLFSAMFIYVLITLISEIMSQVYKIYYLFYKKQYLSAFWWSHLSLPSVRSIFGFAGVVVFLLTFIDSWSPWRNYMVPLSEIIFTIHFVISTVTTLDFFSFNDYFGPKLKLIRTMAYSIFKYMAILSVFWIIYAVCYLSLSEGGINQGNIFWKMFQAGVFEILGELRDEDRVGQFDSCSEILSGNYTELEKKRCTFQSTLIPALTFLYMMTATIMLINVFTAMLSHEYESTSEEAAIYSKFCKYKMLARFESKILFPHPFHLLFYPGWLVYGIKKHWPECCELSPQQGPLSYVSSWFTSSRKWGSSPKDAVVNKEKVDDLFKKVMDQRTSHDFLEEVLKYAKKKKTERGKIKLLIYLLNIYHRKLKKGAELRDRSTSIATFEGDRSRNPAGRSNTINISL